MRLVYILLPILTLTSNFACAQATSPSGAYGFQAGLLSNNSGERGAALLGVINFDGAGNAAGTYTLQNGANSSNLQSTATGSFTGTYSGNADGIGSLTLEFDAGFSLTFATVITEGGQGMQFISTSGGGGANNMGGGFIPLQGPFNSLTGTLPVALFLDGASGNVTFTASPATSPVAGTLVFSSSGGTSSGTIMCADGSSGTWSVTVAALTVAVAVDTPLPGGTGNASGNYVLDLGVKSCGSDAYSQMVSGAVTGNIPSAAPVNLVLHGSGFLVNGVARAGLGTSLRGAYGVRLDSSPVPSGLIGAIKFDGAGNVAFPFTYVGAPGTSLTLPTSNGTGNGTYTINSDGTGTITLLQPNGQPAATFAFIATDGGAQLLLMQTNNSALRTVSLGTAKAQ
jgi:hypothetical protein